MFLQANDFGASFSQYQYQFSTSSEATGPIEVKIHAQYKTLPQIHWCVCVSDMLSAICLNLLDEINPIQGLMVEGPVK